MKNPSQPLALLVEDDSSLRAFLVDVLHDFGVEVLECESAEAALALTLTRARELSLIIADVRLSGEMDGIDFAGEARLRWPSLPFVLISGAWTDRLNGLAPGVIFLSKPLAIEQVERIVRDALSASEGRSRFGR